MEELGGMWSYEEGMEDMKNKLLWMTLELESVKMEASEECKKYQEHMKHLLGVLKMAYLERDEARDRFQKLLDKISAQNPNFNDNTTFAVPVKGNSSVTESNNSHSPVDLASSSDSFLFVNQLPNGPITSSKIDYRPCIIDHLAKGKVLPPKGKLLQAVTDAGPLLQTLLLAGPLPRWRNPPPVQPMRIPQEVLRNGYDHPAYQLCSGPMLRFNGNGTVGSCHINGRRTPSGSSIQVPFAKRQRSQ
ncbi:hypothetical protein SAY86_018222 [Trapa natans]|uniref:Uncharacterized protein n=1 Tax=Trapa natans TaxID=22666 RepID=A0AAN7LGH3_TRANT|nr:hypothetical protein SAY86_018222 [Trapa natans]